MVKDPRVVEELVEKIAYIPVPEPYLAATYAFLAQLMAGDGAAASGERGVVWDRAALDAHLVGGTATIVQLARYLAARPGEDVTSEEVAEALQLPRGWNSLAGALGAFARYLKNRGFQDEQDQAVFPWDISFDRHDGRARLRMSKETAALVQELLGGFAS